MPATPECRRAANAIRQNRWGTLFLTQTGAPFWTPDSTWYDAQLEADALPVVRQYP